MKKLIVAVIALVLVLAVCTTSFAVTFTKSVQCKNTKDYVKTGTSGEKEWDDHRIYVYHNAQGCSNSYTNHFRAYNATEKTLEGSKWVTPGLEIPIQGSGLCDGWKFYLTMRGNTKYNEKEHLSKITLAGWFAVN